MLLFSVDDHQKQTQMSSKRQREDYLKQANNNMFILCNSVWVKTLPKKREESCASVSCDTPHELTPGNNSSLSLVLLHWSPDMENKAKGPLWLYLQDGHYHRRWRPYLACSPLGNTGCKKASDKSNHGRQLPNLNVNCPRGLRTHLRTSFIVLYVSWAWGQKFSYRWVGN